MFGVGSGVVISADAWSPGVVEIVVAVIIVAIVLVGCWIWWLPYLSMSLRRDNWLSYYWETHIEKALGPARPEFLRPPPMDGDTWPSAYDEDPNEVCGNPNDSDRKLPMKWHKVQWAQFAVTFLFGALFILALVSKGRRASEAQGPPSKVTIEGGTLEIDGTSQLKLGEQDARTP